MAVTLVKTMTNNNEPRTMNYSKQTQSNPILSASGGNASADSVLSFRFLAITICCVLPRLPKYTPVVGFGVEKWLFSEGDF
jgi:hypothetical protein